MKSVRQRRIARLLRERTISSQSQLVALLRDAGVPATQATVSRDLEELGAVKVRREGRAAYSLRDASAPAPADELRRVLGESLADLEPSGNILVVRTPPGHASMLASAVDRSALEGVAGTLAGDDTVLLVCKQGVPARRIERKLRALAGEFPQVRAL